MQELDTGTRLVIFFAIAALYYPIYLGVLTNPTSPLPYEALICSLFMGFAITYYVIYLSKQPKKGS